MASRLWPSGLRGRLIAAILAAAVVVLTASFLALHERTGDEIRAGIDDRLRADASEFAASPAGRSDSSPQLAARARQFIAGQGYHPDSRIFVIEAGGRTITNQPGLVDEELREAGASEARPDGPASAIDGARLLGAPPGLVTVALGDDDAELRVLTEPVQAGGTPIGTFRVAESLGQVGFAQGSLRDTLLIVGVIALLILVGAVAWIATLVARPLAQMAEFAAEVDTGRLDRRLEIDGGTSEVRSLGNSFNRMLDRLQGSFEREREFVADASHELRTPITIARGELDLLRRDSDPAEHERIDVVVRELRRMERLISEMLALASEEAAEGLRRRPVALADLLSDLRRDLPLMGPRHYEVAELGGTIEADPDRLAQVLRNLAQNAVNHTEPDGEIRVDARPLGDRLRLEIRDDGPGVQPEEAARLFDRFYRTDTGRSRDRGGSGLGLAITRAIVESHGGLVWAESAPGSGVTVIVELPGYSQDIRSAKRGSPSSGTGAHGGA